jgi:hypothetical protein
MTSHKKKETHEPGYYKNTFFGGDWKLDVYNTRDGKLFTALSKYSDHRDSEEFVRNMTSAKFSRAGVLTRGAPTMVKGEGGTQPAASPLHEKDKRKPYTFGYNVRGEADVSYSTGTHPEDLKYTTIYKPELIAEFIRQIPDLPDKYKPRVALTIGKKTFLPPQGELAMGEGFDRNAELERQATQKTLNELGINKYTVRYVVPYNETYGRNPEENRENVERAKAALIALDPAWGQSRGGRKLS